MIKHSLILVTILLTLNLFAQPNTEIYLLDMEQTVSGINLNNVLNISSNPGYDNQPAFWPDGQSIIYSRTVNGQTEIARYFLNDAKTEIITNTLQGSEYSPTPTPDRRISSIRLDTTGLQLLYSYNLKGQSKVLVDDLVIGYHTWINKSDIVAFVLGDTSTMQIINTKTNKARVVASNIGRSLHKIPGSNQFSYVDKSSKPWLIKSMDPVTEESKILVNTLEGSEDYCWMPNGFIIMGSASKLFLWKGKGDWIEIANLVSEGISNITRVSVSPDGTKLTIAAE
ncbi:TolB family protein [Ekhidna sp.]|uniref:TolB family protein n=1 Tax=Ekhidna sp. TaxID=2608089 RepID=UPI003B5C982A